MDTQICRVCGIDKPMECYHKRSTHSSERRTECKACHHAAHMKRIHTNPETRQKHARRTNWRKGIVDWQDWEQRYIDATHCSICGVEFTNPRHKQLDHDHKTGLGRGIICGHCNRALGQVNDNVTHLHQLINYLEQHNGGSE